MPNGRPTAKKQPETRVGCMTSDFSNVYDDVTRAAAYAGLQFPGTYYLAFRDLPDIFTRHVRGTAALDFGCGAGRSTRFLQDCGFQTLGVDISAPMLARARERDPEGEYRLVQDGDLSAVAGESFDLILAAFTFDNVPTDRKHSLFGALRRLLAPDGRIVNLVSAPEIYLHEWASFSTKDFPTNRSARTGDTVLIEESRPLSKSKAWKVARLLERATGRTLDPAPYIEHLTRKYSEIYGI